MSSSSRKQTKHYDVLLALSRYDHRTHRGIMRFASEHNWHLNCDHALSGTLPEYWQGDGIITLMTKEDQNTVDFVLSRNTHQVDLSIMRMDVQVPRVSADHQAIGGLAAEHFIAKGFRHFAFFSTTDDAVSHSRKNGFYQGIEAHATQFNDWILPKEIAKNQKLHKHIQHLLRGAALPLAVFCNRDNDAALLLGVCQQENLGVPEQVAILGVDNNELFTNSLKIPISSVNHDVEALGYEGATLLHEVMTTGARRTTLPKPKLVQPSGITARRSTDCLAVNNKLVSAALSQINHNYAQTNYTVAKAAENCGVSRRHLDNLFLQELGFSMHVALNNTRLRQAHNALLTTTDSIAKISAYCGFTRVQYFNKCFKKFYGKTPSELRKNVRLT